MTRSVILSQAIERRDSAAESAAYWATEAARWDSIVKGIEELEAGMSFPPRQQKIATNVVPPSLVDNAPTGTSERAPNESRLAVAEAVALRIIQEKGRPVPSRELLFEALKIGLDVGGRDELATFTARLSRSSKIFNDKPHGWRLKAASLEEGTVSSEPLTAEEPTVPVETPNDAEAARGGGI